jgi:hypothetical protein
VVPAPLPSDGGGWLAVFGLLRGAWFADLVRNFLEFIFCCKCFLCCDFIPVVGGRRFWRCSQFRCGASWGLETDVAAGRAESLLSSVLNSQISLHQR